MTSISEISTYHIVTVRMEYGLYDNGKNMLNIAKKVTEQKKAEGITPPIIVNIQEHGGWYLWYVEDPDNPGAHLIVESANESGYIAHRAREFLSAVRHKYSETLPDMVARKDEQGEIYIE